MSALGITLVGILGLVVVVLLVALWTLTHTRSGRFQDLNHLDARKGRFAHLSANLCLSTAHAGNHMEVLENGDAFWPALRSAIRGAQHSVHFETFLWKTGELSASLVDVLCDRAQAGVQVRMIIDAVGGGDMSEAEQERLRSCGVKLHLFRPRSWRHIGTFNTRDHRKVAVIDAEQAFIGGHCVDDGWLGDADDPDRVRDTSVRIQGPAVSAVQQAFAENWTEVTGELLADEKHFPELSPQGDVCAFVAYVNFEQRVSAVKTLHMLAVATARDTLVIQNPYFILDHGAQDMLIRAAKGGTRIRVMTPSQTATDEKAVFHAMRHGLRPLLEAGIQVYAYERCLMHHKLVVVDGHWAIFGSTNFDFRSFEINEEISVSAFDTALAQQLTDNFENDLEHSTRFTLSDLDARGPRARVLDFLAWTIRTQL